MDERWVDVSHEALIRGWPRLREWIDKDRAGLQLHHRLNEATKDWQQSNRDANLLYRGSRLTQAVEWRERNETELNALEREFLDASVALRTQEQAIQERRRRRTIWGLSVGLCLALSLTGVAGWQWWRAEQQRRLALARQLMQGAELADSRNTGSDTTSSVLLAVASVKVAETPEADNFLERLTSLQSRPPLKVWQAHPGLVTALSRACPVCPSARMDGSSLQDAVTPRSACGKLHTGKRTDGYHMDGWRGLSVLVQMAAF